MISNIVAKDHPLHLSASEKANEALEKSQAGKIIARSPLLLTIAASLILRGGDLGRTKTELYAKIFEIVNEKPNSRVPIPPASSAVLNRFLEILGWNLLLHPLVTVSDLNEWCAAQVRVDLECNLLRAREITDKCLAYWQDVGMIERVQHAGEEAITFIHKTFGEFAAARYLVGLSGDAQSGALSVIYDKDAWSEVIAFAGSLGLADQISARMVDGRSEDATRVGLNTQALALVADSDTPPNPTIRQRILARSFEYIGSQRRGWAYDVGKALIPCAKRFPAEVGPLANQLLTSEQPWTRLVAWSCAVIAGPSYYDLEGLKDYFEILPKVADGGLRSSLGGGLILGTGNYELLQELLVIGSRQILERCPADVADALLPGVLSAENLQTWGTMTRISALLKEKGKSYAIYKQSATETWTTGMLAAGGYAGAQRRSYEIIFGPILNSDSFQVTALESQPKVFLHFSAFLRLTKFLEMPAYDVWAWQEADQQADVAEVLRGLISVLPIERGLLIRDIVGFLSRLRALPDEDVFHMWDSIAHVDVPEIDWGRAKKLDLDRDKLENALYHKSEWLCAMAGTLLEAVSPPDQLRLSVERLFAKGSRNTLWIAAQLLAALDKSVAEKVAFARLQQHLSSGCEYIFDYLRKSKQSLTDQVFSAVRYGLLSNNPKIAIAAARLAADLIEPTAPGLYDLLTEAYQHWLQHEEPYPTKGGTVPDSPREEILLAQFKVRQATAEQLLIYAKDVRSDVSGVGTNALLKMLSESKNAREIFVTAAVQQQIPASLLTKVLRADPPLSPPQVHQLLSLLSSTDPRFRYAAVSLLKERYLPWDRIEPLARERTRDAEVEIREAAFRALENRSN